MRKKSQPDALLISKMQDVYKILDESSPEEIRFLPRFDEPWQFLFAVMLTAQSTDERVCKICPVLFARYPSLKDFTRADIHELEDIIRPVGLYHAKAKNLIACAKELSALPSFPDTMEALVSLPGVGRKTASCVIGDVFGRSAVIVDTHFSRLMLRLGFCPTREPEAVERRVAELLSDEKRYRFSMTANLFARSICTSRHPKCKDCILAGYCQICEI